MPKKKRSRAAASKRKSRKSRKSATGRHRRAEPGCTYLITRKTNDDLYWLTPSALSDAVLLFLLLLKAKKYGVLIHAFIFLSTHFHLVITDVEGALPAFMGELLSESGKALKLVRKTSRTVWGGRRYSAVQLLDRDAAERACAYAALNPTEAALTDPEAWPGLTSARHRFGETITAKRPGIYFSDNRPESVSLALAPLPRAFPGDPPGDPPTLESPVIEGETIETTEESIEDASESRIRELIESGRAAIHRRLEREGKRLAGIDRVLRTPWTKRAKHPVGGRNPRFATRNKQLMQQAIEDLKQFELDHEAAKQRYIAGHHRTIFPSGTYGYRVVLGVRVAKRRRRAA